MGELEKNVPEPIILKGYSALVHFINNILESGF